MKQAYRPHNIGRSVMPGLILFGMLLVASAMGPSGAQAMSQSSNELELSQAVLVTPADLSGPERKAVAMLLDEVEHRSRLRWVEAHEWPASGPVVAVTRREACYEVRPPPEIAPCMTSAR